MNSVEVSRYKKNGRELQDFLKSFFPGTFNQVLYDGTAMLDPPNNVIMVGLADDTEIVVIVKRLNESEIYVKEEIWEVKIRATHLPNVSRK